jgi:hypothetical protein
MGKKPKDTAKDAAKDATVKSVSPQQLDRLLLSEHKKRLIRALLQLAPEAEAFLHDDEILVVQPIRVNNSETQADYQARVQSFILGAPPRP